jgi:biopolymer transport protein ExbD
MRIARKSPRGRETIALNLASMIDVTFLLLLYFLVTTVLAMPEDRLSPSLRSSAETAAGPDSDFQPQIVEVRLLGGAPAYYLGTEVFQDRQALTSALEPLHKPSGLFVKVFDEVPVAAAAAAIQAGRDAGFERLTYVAAK